ncbi:response regulator transcription factor [Zhaonella formicivorans]|uniref:response regulator transcription factor n=1 Tax=Zhaonella formicivorans TaxID=2528593 RepID=UPI0024145631|nr:response regulator transcription factor [Zhaonella formicivorans]
MGKQKIMIVEDEPKIAEMISAFLLAEGYETAVCQDGDKALQELTKFNPDLVVLDLMLPGMSGLEICKQIRQESNLPIIMLTAKAEEIDKLLGLELGADDYITKPFSLRELLARIKAVLRRASQTSAIAIETVNFSDLKINFSEHVVELRGTPIELTPTEFSILGLLAKNPGRTFSRAQILDSALGVAYLGYERSVDSHISNIRKKIEDDPANPKYILTVFGVGYKFAKN